MKSTALKTAAKAFLIALVIPCLLLTGLEFAARLAGAGYPSQLFIREKGGDGSEYLRVNYRAAKRYFPGHLARRPLPEIMPAVKPAGRLRIFVLGESAARGEQLADFSFARMLEACLNDGRPEKVAEVINTGIPAINSWVLREFAREILNYSPDLLIIYAGHNEFIGPYGPAGLNGLATHRNAALAGIWASSLRLIQALKGDRIPENLASGWKGLEMFLSNLILPGSEAITRCQNNWRANLNDIFSTAKQAGVPVIWCRVPVNRRDCPPFASDETGFDDTIRAAVASISQAISTENFSTAAQQLQPLKNRFGGNAMLSYLEGRVRLSEGNRQQAAKNFGEALANDCFRIRTTDQFNDTAAECAQLHGALLADVEKTFTENSEAEIIGCDLVYDHVHLTLKGHYLAARTIFKAMQQLFPQAKQLPADFPTLEAMVESIGYTANDEIEHWQHVIDSMSLPPFTLQPGNSMHLSVIKSRLEENRKALNPEACIIMTRAAAGRQPGNWAVLNRLAMLCHEDPVQAEKCFIQSLALNQFNIDTINNYGLLLLTSGRKTEAEKMFLQALEIAPDFARAHYNLGLIHAEAPGTVEQAKTDYMAATRNDPGMAAAWRNLANLYFRQGSNSEALKIYRQAIKSCPDDILLHLGAGNCLLQMQKFEEGQRVFSEAAGRFPESPLPLYSLGLACEKQKQFKEAGDYYQKSGRLKHLPAFTRLFELQFAGKLSLSSKAIVSDATLACQISDFSDPWLMQVLAAGYLENGQKQEAAGILHRALATAEAQGKNELAAEIKSNLKLTGAD